MNLNIWKYRYRRFRSLSFDDVTRRVELRSWRKNLVNFVENESTSITNQTIKKWLNLRFSSNETGKLDSDTINSSLFKSTPSGFLTDPEFWKTFKQLYPVEEERLIHYALAVTEGRIELFGWKPVSVSVPSLKLQNSYVNQIVKDWGDSYYWDINFFHDKDNPSFDVKWLWELERLQFLLWLGAAWKLTGDDKFSSVAREILAAWFERLKYPYGVEWSSNLEVGLRLLSISRCHIMCMDSPSWNSEFVSKAVSWQYLHATHLRHEITLHHTLGNHQLGEVSSLLWFATVYPGFQESDVWKKYACIVINRVIPKLILSDGVYVEQSTGYLKFAAEFILPLIIFNGSVEAGFSSKTIQLIKSCLEFVRSLSSFGKQTPMIGDSDSGSAIGWRLSDYWDFSWLLAAGGTLLNEPRLAAGIKKLPAEAFLNIGIVGLHRFNTNVSRKGKHTSRPEEKSSGYVDFPVGGYHVSYDSYFRLVFDTGPLGIYPGFGHGHADALSILVNVKNRPIIVDSGTMHYNAESDVRGYFRNTQAHNTLSVNGKGQVEILDTFRWASDYRVTWADTVEGEDYRVFSGLLSTDSFIHERIVVHVLEKGFTIWDRVQSDTDISIEGFLHFAPDVRIESSGTGKFLASHEDEVLEVVFSESALVSAELVRGSVNPILGWYSRSYGKMIPTNCLKYRVRPKYNNLIIIKRPGVSLEWPLELSDLSSHDQSTFGGPHDSPFL